MRSFPAVESRYQKNQRRRLEGNNFYLRHDDTLYFGFENAENGNPYSGIRAPAILTVG